MPRKNSLKQRLCTHLASLPTVAVGARFTAAALSLDRPFATPVELWLSDERLRRAMRAAGIPEEEITGAAADYEKLSELIRALPATVGSMLGADLAADLALLAPTALQKGSDCDSIWREATAYLAAHRTSPRTLLAKNRLSLISMGPDEYRHICDPDRQIRPMLSLAALMRPGTAECQKCLQTVAKTSGIFIKDLATLEAAIAAVVDRFAVHGTACAVLDASGLALFVRPDPYRAMQLLARLLDGACDLTAREEALWQAQLLRTLGRVLAAREGRLVLRALPEERPTNGGFRTLALGRLLAYLEGEGALVPTLLSLPAGGLPTGLAALLGTFAAENGTPRLYFGIEGRGAGLAALRRSLRFYLRHGAAPLLLGITDDDVGHFTSPTKLRFCRVLAEELSALAAEDASFVGETALFATASGIYTDGAARFFGFS